MTPARKRYLDGIGEDERAIRNAIDHLKIFIRNDKDGLKNGIDATIDGLKWDIRNCKYVIKALKKALPANKEQYLHWVDYCPNCLEKISNEANYCQNCGRQLFQYVCPICKVSTEFRQDYCCKCGQKLR